MSYLKKRYAHKHKKKHGLSGLGDLTSSLESLFSNAEGAVGAALNASQDPYLPEVACRFNQLAAINANHPVGTCNDTPSGLPGGIGLRNLIVPLRGYVYAQQHKWVYPLAIAAVVGVPMAIGYALGKGRKSGGGS